MDIPLDEVIYFDAISSSSTGAAADADSTPTFAVYEEATDTDIGVGGNMTKRTSLTGNYRGSFTASAANGFELGKWYAVIGSATVGGIACKGVLRTFRIVAAEATAGYPVITTKVGTGTGEINVSSGKVPATIAAGDIANSAITAASIASDAITDAKVASDVTIASVTGAVGSVTGNVGGNVTGSVGSIATGGIAAASFAAGAIDAAAIATDAIGSAELAASAITEIQAGLSTLDAAGVRTAVGLASANLDTQLSTIAGYIDTEIATLVTNVATILAAVDTEVGAIKAVTDAITATGTGLSAIPWNASWDAEVQSEVQDAIEANNLDHLLKVAAVTGDVTNSSVIARLSSKSATPAFTSFDNTTDSLEAIRDRGDSAWTTGSGGAGAGARTVTITVNDGTSALEAAKVRVSQGAESYVVSTNASGVATFSLDDATWAVAITKAGYSFTPTTLVVDGTETQTYSMTAVTITPSDPSQTTGYVTIYTGAHVAVSGAVVEIQILKLANGTTGSGIDDPLISGTTSGSGYVEFTGLPRLAAYQVRIGEGKWYRGVTADAAATPLAGVLGMPE